MERLHITALSWQCLNWVFIICARFKSLRCHLADTKAAVSHTDSAGVRDGIGWAEREILGENSPRWQSCWSLASIWPRHSSQTPPLSCLNDGSILSAQQAENERKHSLIRWQKNQETKAETHWGKIALITMIQGVWSCQTHYAIR